mmetsp:Transcript_101609/g.291242  ORF Transcript_101609/g.291242 Transcript_101609/m.291242 type:complete len:240 (+) Transcript_101609:344-1063(+)
MPSPRSAVYMSPSSSWSSFPAAIPDFGPPSAPAKNRMSTVTPRSRTPSILLMKSLRVASTPLLAVAPSLASAVASAAAAAMAPATVAVGSDGVGTQPRWPSKTRSHFNAATATRSDRAGDHKQASSKSCSTSAFSRAPSPLPCINLSGTTGTPTAAVLPLASTSSPPLLLPSPGGGAGGSSRTWTTVSPMSTPFSLLAWRSAPVDKIHCSREAGISSALKRREIGSKTSTFHVGTWRGK